MPRIARSSCSLPNVKICKRNECGNVAVSFDGLCSTHAPIRRIKSYNSRPSCSRMKNPIGMELELVHPRGHYHITPIARYVCSDASIGYDGGEIKFVAPADKIADKAADIAQRAAHAGCKVNKRCGFHVHNSLPDGVGGGLRCQSSDLISEGYYQDYAIKRLYNFAKVFEEYFFDIVPQSRQKNGYCARLTNAASLHNHYSWLSLSHRVPTVELRIHGATVNPWKVKGWMEVNIRMRELMHEVILDNNNESALSITQKSAKFSDFMPDGSLGKKYLLARENAGGSLTEFGF